MTPFKKLIDWLLPEENGYAILRAPDAYEIYKHDELIARYLINSVSPSYHIFNAAYQYVLMNVDAEVAK